MARSKTEFIRVPSRSKITSLYLYMILYFFEICDKDTKVLPNTTQIYLYVVDICLPEGYIYPKDTDMDSVSIYLFINDISECLMGDDESFTLV